MKDLFKPEDFRHTKSIAGLCIVESMIAADIANKKLNKLIESWPLAYGNVKNIDGGLTDKKYWCATQINHKDATHIAQLAFIEPIKPKECEHKEPVHELRHSVTSETLFPGTVGFSYFGKADWRCRDCGKKLTVKWEVAE